MPSRPDQAPDPAPDEAPPEPLRWRAFLGVYLLLLLIGTETFLVSPLLPTIADSIDVSEAAAATTVTAYTLAYALTAPFLGAVSDRFGRQPTIVAGTVLFLLGNVVAAVAGGLTVLVIARIVGALGAALAGPSIWAHLAERAPEQARGRAIGTGLALFSAGQVLGVPLASFLAGAGGWRASFWALAVLSAVAVPLVWRQTRPAAFGAATATTDAAPAPRLRLAAVFSVWADPLLRRVLLVVLLLQGANLGAYTFIGAVLDDHFDLSVTALGLIGVLVGIGSAAGSVAGGRIGDAARRRGHDDRGWIPLWCLVLGGGTILAVWGAPLPVAGLAVVVWFFASGAFGANVQALLVEARPALAATSSSWNSALLYGGAAIGVFLIQRFSDVDLAVTLVAGAMALTATALSLGLVRRRDCPAVPSPHTPGPPSPIQEV
ncbi:MFS transporter [Patulibacter defluvii]|uniref:MFS transporter n=1 Tax=Patulibacter defluvii TaxID=3095358 RepID=UPI002A7561FE|nr:MFS transporter [Patulibacter sp. DM4]